VRTKQTRSPRKVSFQAKLRYKAENEYGGRGSGRRMSSHRRRSGWGDPERVALLRDL